MKIINNYEKKDGIYYFEKNIINVGSSPYSSSKRIFIGSGFKEKTYIINKDNWVLNDTYNDTFEISISNGFCNVKRIDLDSGWKMNLIIKLELLDEISKPNMKIQIIKECPGTHHYDAHNIYNSVRVFNNRYLTWDCNTHSFTL